MGNRRLYVENQRHLRAAFNDAKRQGKGKKADNQQKIISLRISFRNLEQIQTEEFATLIQHANQSETISLNNIELVGEFALVAAALLSCGQLRDFAINRSQLSSVEDWIALGQVLAQIPQLEVLSIFPGLFASGHAQAIQPPIQVMTPVLQAVQSCRLKEISFYSSTAGPAALTEETEAFFSAAENCSRLQKLTFSMRGTNFSTSTIDSIGRMIERTTTLERLRLGMNRTISLVGLAGALNHNTSLKRLSVSIAVSARSGRSATKAEEVQAFHATLKDHNFTLRELDVGSFWGRAEVDSRLQEEIKFYLSLNQMGRDRLLAPGETVKATADEWVKAIANQDNPSYIFYFLSKNPSLCLPHPINYTLQQKASNGKKRRKMDSESPTAPATSKKRRIHSPERTGQGSSGIVGIVTQAITAMRGKLEQNPTKISTEELAAFETEVKRARGALEKCMQLYNQPSQEDAAMVTPNK